MTASSTPHQAQLQDLQARVGARLAARLDQAAAELPHDVAERLRVGRETAVLRARQHRLAQAAATAPVAVAAGSGSSSGSGMGGSGFWLGLAAWMPLLVLVLGLVLIDQWTRREQVLAAAEIDALLLADDLPPAAWNDPGFREFLKSSPP